MSAICRIVAAALLFGVLSACDDEASDAPQSDSIFPDTIGAGQRECEKKGGRWSAVGNSTLFTCYRNLPDANKSCRTESDCEGYCLARSRTCSPIEPLLGCHEVISSRGLPQTVCVR